LHWSNNIKVLKLITILKSSGSKTLSALLMLVLSASIFFISCGLPKNPFIINTVLESSESNTPIVANTATDTINFYINIIDDIYTDNGINLYYCYSYNKDISLSSPSNWKFIYTSSFYNPQQIKTVSEEEFDLYIFQIGEDNIYSLPSINIDEILSNLPSGNTSLEGELQATYSDGNTYLNLSLYYLDDLNYDLLSNGLLVRFAEVGGEDSLILSSSDYDNTSDTLDNYENNYYIHIFSSYYAYEPLTYSSDIAVTSATYLGSVKLP